MAKKWIQKAINPKHKGYCTPMTKSTCTPHRKALARRLKSGDLSRKKKQIGGPVATAGVDSGINYDAMKYNEFFGPLQDELKILQKHGEKTGNKKLAMAAVLGQRNIGNYYETPLMKELFRKDIPNAKTIKGKLLKAGIKTKAGGRKLINMSSGMDSNTAADFAFPNSSLTKEQRIKVADKMLPYIQERLKEEYGIFSGAARPDEILRRMYKENPELFIPELGIGGTIADTIGGAGTGFLSAGPIGAVIGGVTGLIGGLFKSKQEKEEAKRIAEEQRQAELMQLANNRISTLEPSMSYMPVAQYGGFIDYEGQSHSGPDGGIPVDSQGNPVRISKNNPVALTEGGEVAWYSPSGEAYIFSDKLGFADPARTILKDFRIGTSLEHKDEKTEEAVVQKFTNLMNAQEDMKSKLNAQKLCKGGRLRKMAEGGSIPSPEKAKKMLEDGTINGKPLTEKQKKFFRALAHGWKPTYQGDEPYPSMLPVPKPYQRPGAIPSLPFTNIPGLAESPYLNFTLESGMNPYTVPKALMDSTSVNIINRNPNLPTTSQANLSYGTTPSFNLESGRNPYNRPPVNTTWPTNPYYGFNEMYNLQGRGVSNSPTAGLATGTQPGFMLESGRNPYALPEIDTTWPLPYNQNIDNTYQAQSTAIPQPAEDSFEAARKASNKAWTEKIGFGESNLNPLPITTVLPEIYKTALRSRGIEGDLQSGETPVENLNAGTTPDDIPYLAPIGHALSAIGNIADYFTYRNQARPRELNMPMVTPQKVSYAAERAAMQEQARTSRRMIGRTARDLGLNAGQTMAATSAGITGVDRLLGQNVSQSFDKQVNQNAILRQQADMQNAELQARERIYNAQMDAQYREGLAQRNPLANIPKIAASYFADNAAYQQGFDTLKMLAPNAEIYKPEGSIRFLGIRPSGIRFRGKRV